MLYKAVQVKSKTRHKIVNEINLNYYLYEHVVSPFSKDMLGLSLTNLRHKRMSFLPFVFGGK